MAIEQRPIAPRAMSILQKTSISSVQPSAAAAVPVQSIAQASAASACTPRFVCLVVGYPKTGKTGSLAALVHAGFNVILCDFDGNPHSLLRELSEEERARVLVVPFHDKMAPGADGGVTWLGEPKAINNFLRFMTKGTFTYPDGRQINLGPSGEWDSNTIVALDTTTSMGESVMRRYLHSIGRTERTKRLKDWGVAAKDLQNILEMFKAPHLPYHLVVLSHLKTIGPDFAEDPEATKATGEARERIDMNNAIRAQQVAAGVKTRNYPTGIGKALPQMMASLFPCSVLMEVENGQRVIRTQASDVVDIGVPGKVRDRLPIATGMLTIFKAVTGIDCPEPVEEMNDDSETVSA